MAIFSLEESGPENTCRHSLTIHKQPHWPVKLVTSCLHFQVNINLTHWQQFSETTAYAALSLSPQATWILFHLNTDIVFKYCLKQAVRLAIANVDLLF